MGVIIRAETCCLYVLLTCSKVFSWVSHSCVRETKCRLVSGLWGRSTGGNIINKFKAQLSLKDMHESLLSDMMCVLPQVLHYGNLWESVTAWVLGKLLHYVPRDSGIFIEQPYLGALYSQTTQLIKTSQFRPGWILEFLSRTKQSNSCSHSERICYFKSNISRSLREHTTNDRVGFVSFSCSIFDAFTVHGLSEQWCKNTDY